MIFAAAPAMFVLSIVPPNPVDVMNYKYTVWLTYVFPILIVGLPVAMLILGRLRGKVWPAV